MKRYIILLAAVACVLAVFNAAHSDPGYGDPLYIRTEYHGNKDSGALLPVVKSNVDAGILKLGEIKLVSRGFDYIIRTRVEVTASSSGTKFIELKSRVIDTAGGSGNAVYEARKTGTISELGRLCDSLVRKLDRRFLAFKYVKTPEKAKEEDRVSQFLKRKSRSSRVEEIDLDAMHRERMIDAVKADMMAQTGGIDPEEVAREVSAAGGRKLSGAEKDFAAKYPDKLPRIAQITQYAQFKSSAAASSDPSVPEDAYRHVLWSYLLTREFGPDFAKLVTDTHEVGPTGNTPEEKIMDYNNNMVGVGYALQGVAEENILEMVQNDPGVIKSAR